MGEKTRGKIDHILDRINTHPEYSASVTSEFVAYLASEADRHSYSIEAESDEPIARKDADKESLDQRKRLREARKYLGKEGLTLSSVLGFSHILEPEKNSTTTFRTEEVQFGEFYGVAPSKIMDTMEQVLYKINNDDFKHSIDRAIYSHLETLRVHPFKDGNGRASRILQNFLLEQRGYPPVIVPVNERDLYFGLLNGIWREDMNNSESHEREDNAHNIFRDYIDSKVLESSEKLEETLRKKRIYKVNFDNVKDKDMIGGIAKSLKGWGHKSEIPLTANKIRKSGKKASMIIQGDVGEDALSKFLTPKTKRHSLKFNVKSIDCF